MKGIKLLAAAALLISFGCKAGAYGDELNKCAVDMLDDDQKEVLIHWMFVAWSKHPKNTVQYKPNELADNITARAAGSVFADVLGRACKKEADVAVNVEGGGAIYGAVGAMTKASFDTAYKYEKVSEYINMTDVLFAEDLKKTRERSERFKH